MGKCAYNQKLILRSNELNTWYEAIKGTGGKHHKKDIEEMQPHNYSFPVLNIHESNLQLSY